MSEWKFAELKDLVKSDRPITYGIVQTGEHIEDGIPCVRVVDLTNRNLDPKNMIKTSHEISESYGRTILEQDDIMFALRGEIGFVTKVPEWLVGANLTRGVALISPRAEVLPDYLLYAIQSDEVRQEIMMQVNGSALKEIPLSGLRKVKIPLPPLEEQRKIAAILGTWDKAIDLLQRLTEALQARTKGLMQKLLTGEVRFAEFEAEAWREIKLREIVTKIGSGVTPKGGSASYLTEGIPLIRSQNVLVGQLDLSDDQNE
jgi:type I restriction enzyme, S subunit